MIKQQITVDEALAQGYMHYCFDGEGYQTVLLIEYFVDNGDKGRSDAVVCEKEAQHPAGMDAEDIKNLIFEDIECNWAGGTSDDTDSVRDALEGLKLDFTDISNKITEALSAINYYTGTEIQLIPNPPTE